MGAGWQGELRQFADDDYLVIDCPGQIELYSHIPVMQNVVRFIKVCGWVWGGGAKPGEKGGKGRWVSPSLESPPLPPEGDNMCVVLSPGASM